MYYVIYSSSLNTCSNMINNLDTFQNNEGCNTRINSK